MWDFSRLVFSDPEDGGDMFLHNVGLKLYGLHSVISQKMILFITTGVKTSNPTNVHLYTTLKLRNRICFIS
jgi:hypothetical protein